MRILFYTTASGRRPVQNFIQEQPKVLQAAIGHALDSIQQDGLAAPGVSFRQIRGKLWEIRVRAGGAARIFYVIVVSEGDEERMYLLHAYLKKTQRAPLREIETAERRMGEILR